MEKWKLESALPAGLEAAAKRAFVAVSHSSSMDMGDEHDWRGPDCGWWDGIKIGEVTASDQVGEICTWDAFLQQAAGIMMGVHGFSRWRLRIMGR
jgi:hypothetical protein